MKAEKITIECDESGFYMIVETEGEGPFPYFNIADPEALYDQVKARIGPWLRERDAARGEFKQALTSGTGPAADYFACKDPEGDWMRDVALGAMGVGESLEAAAAALDSIDLTRKAERENR